MKLKLLIITDNVLLEKDVKRAFKDVDEVATVDCAPDAFEALYKCQTSKPDVVLVDIEIVLLKGFDLPKMIKIISPSTKTIYTGTLEKSVYRNYLDSKYSDYFIQNNNLKEDIRKILALMESENVCRDCRKTGRPE